MNCYNFSNLNLFVEHKQMLLSNILFSYGYHDFGESI